jgi:endonuclease-8
MPEGDTLRRLAESITGRFAGDVVRRAELRDPRLVGVELVGRTLLDADAYGKHLFVRFGDGLTLHAHLLMTGSFSVGPPSREVEWKRRVELWLDRGRLTGESVPKLGAIRTDAEEMVTAELGPDLCARSGPPDVDLIVARLVRLPDAPLSGALLDQRNVAGFGNVYVNDLPFVVGVDPFQPVGTIEGLADLVAIGTAVIRVNAELGRQNTTGRRLGADARWLHGAGRRPCPVCGDRLSYRSERSSPWGRSITWCPSCQPARSSAVVDRARAWRLIGLHPATRRPPFPGR